MRKVLQKIQFEVHLADHCNLNCQMCDHFSPIAKKSFLSPTSYESDLMRLGDIFDHQATYIRLLGGEPLLHPCVSQFFSITRTYFPHCPLELYTNGLLLPIQLEDFWDACQTFSVKIMVTKYPVNFDYSAIENLAQKHRVELIYTSQKEEPVKTSWHLPLDVSGGQNPETAFRKCDMGNVCIFLKDGRLYPCTVAPNVVHFNRYFHQELEISDKDSIDIYTAEAREILEFLAQPIPFCKYCNIDSRRENIPWAISKKDISEWT